jgi:predicted dehydrogenase
MASTPTRRELLVLAAAGQGSARAVRIGVAGVGSRGMSLLSVLVAMPGVAVPAVCDVNPARTALAQDRLVKAGRPRPEAYNKDEYSWRDLVARDDLDGVVIATPWHWNGPVAIGAMKAGRHAAVEVPAALSIEECWELVNTSERTGRSCMMLENWSFRRDNLAVLNMIRAGLFGEIVHCHCAHSHNCVDHWFFDTQGNPRWSAEFLLKYNRDQYPTHSLGPVLSWMNIGCGDMFDSVVSMATRALGPNMHFRAKFGDSHPYANRAFAQGDIVTTLVKTKLGNTIVINYDMQLPRPYDNRWMIQGTRGVYKEQTPAEASQIYLAGQTDNWPEFGGPGYEAFQPFDPWRMKYDHEWWKGLDANADARRSGHGGTDWLTVAAFVESVRAGRATPIDVYDSVLMSSIIPLSGLSIARGSQPVPCPDFTRGKWRTRRPEFG